MGSPSDQSLIQSTHIAKWTLPITLLVTVIGFWWHSRKKKKPDEVVEETTELTTKESSKTTTSSNGTTKKNGNAVVVSNTSSTADVHSDLKSFIETVQRLNETPSTKSNGHAIPCDDDIRTVSSPSVKSTPKPCTPPKNNTARKEEEIIASSVKYLESVAAVSYMESRHFGVEKIEDKTNKSTPTTTSTAVKKSPSKRWSEIIDEDSSDDDVTSTTTTTSLQQSNKRHSNIVEDTIDELQFDIEHVSSSTANSSSCLDDSGVRHSLTNSSICDNSTDRGCGDYNTKSYSESDANAEVDTIIKTSGSTDSDQQQQQRDSANHSPNTDAMLTSPSLSDVHSEGSSDSGKGCSEASRTPVGGSSVSGEQWTSYDFVLPQVMVGRLIGKGGSFIHRVRSHTHTKIYIKRHPNTFKLKICAVEGTQPDIDQALELIREKFPISLYPFLSMEKVTFLSSNSLCCPLRPEPFQLQLVEGINNDVYISSLVSAGRFFVQLPTHPSYQSLESLNLLMNTTYNSAQAPLLPAPVENALVAAPTMGGWFRAQILTVNPESLTCYIKFVDYGGYLNIETSSLRQIRADFLSLPFQAIECALANIIPSNGTNEWTEEARTVVHGLTNGHVVQAQVYDYNEEGLPLIYLYTVHDTEVVLVNQELVERDLACLDQSTSISIVNTITPSDEDITAQEPSEFTSPEESTVSIQHSAPLVST